MNKFEVMGNITDPKKFNRFGDDEEPGIFATIVMNKYKGKDKDNKPIMEPVYIKFAAYGNNAITLNKLDKGARIIVELSPHNRDKEIGGKKYQSIEFNCGKMTIIDWPEKDERPDGTSYREVNADGTSYKGNDNKKGWE